MSRRTSRALQRWWRLTEAPWSRLLKWLTWAGHEALAEEGWTLESSSRSPASFTAFLPCGIAPPLTACQYPAHFPMLSLSTLSHETILDSFLPAGFLRLCSHLSSLIKDPSYSTPSFVHMHTASLSSWRVRSVHEALCWTLTLIISNPYNKLTGSPGPISQMRKLRLSKVISLV